MKTKQQVEKEFRQDLFDLLKKWKAEVEAEDHYGGYPECGEDVRMTVTVPAEYDKEGNTLQEWTEIDLGRWLRHDEEITILRNKP